MMYVARRIILIVFCAIAMAAAMFWTEWQSIDKAAGAAWAVIQPRRTTSRDEDDTYNKNNNKKNLLDSIARLVVDPVTTTTTTRPTPVGSSSQIRGGVAKSSTSDRQQQKNGSSTTMGDTEDDAMLVQSVARAIDDATSGKDTHHPRLEDNNKSVHHKKLNKIKVDVYGGSVARGGGLHDRHMNRFSALLEQNFPELEVTNKAIGASGPGHWVNCGITPADIIISEFRINESSRKTLQEWYNLTHQHAQHTVILDIWSWLNPPNPQQKSATIGAFQKMKESFPDNKASFSILSLEKQDSESWRELLPLYFNYSDTDRPIPKKCFKNAGAGKDEAQKKVMANCRLNHANYMQHGREPFHEHIYQELAKHFRNKVLPNVSPQAAETMKSDAAETRHTRCIGNWGIVAQLHTKDAFLSWNESIIHQSGYAIRNPFSQRTDKITLNTNSTSAMLTLGCPPPFNQSMKVGYIAHGDRGESGVVSLNGIMNISTWLGESETRPNVRIRKYAPLVSVPVEVSVLELQSGAFIEFTDVACY